MVWNYTISMHHPKIIAFLNKCDASLESSRDPIRSRIVVTTVIPRVIFPPTQL